MGGGGGVSASPISSSRGYGRSGPVGNGINVFNPDQAGIHFCSASGQDGNVTDTKTASHCQETPSCHTNTASHSHNWDPVMSHQHSKPQPGDPVMGVCVCARARGVMPICRRKCVWDSAECACAGSVWLLTRPGRSQGSWEGVGCWNGGTVAWAVLGWQNRFTVQRS